MRFSVIRFSRFVEGSDFGGRNLLKRSKFADGISAIRRENGTQRNNLLVLRIVNWPGDKSTQWLLFFGNKVQILLQDAFPTQETGA